MKAAFFTALGTLFLLGGAWVAWRCHEPMLARHWYAQLRQSPENDAPSRVDQLARLGAAGVPYLVQALDDPREPVAQRARRTLWDSIAEWERLPPAEAATRLVALIDALDAHVDSFGPSAQWEAGQLTVRLLQWPLGGVKPDGRRMIAACQRILKKTETQAPPQRDLAETPASQAARSAAESRAIAALLAAPKLPGGGLLQESAADAPGFAADGPSRRPAEPHPLRVVGPVATARRPSEGVASPPERSPNDSPQGRSNEGGQISPLSHVTPARRSAQPESPDWEEMVQRMRQLRSDDPKVVEDARFALAMRGFTEKHFELARRVFDPQVEVRRQTARSLPTMPGVDASPWLLLMARDAHPEVRSTALGLLATSPDAALAAKARRLAAEDSDSDVQAQTNPAKRR